MFKRDHNLGFSLLEFIIAMTILTIISSLTSAAVHHLKITHRNARRVADIADIQTGLEMYYRLAHKYPLTLTPGESLTYNGQTIMGEIPQNPVPRDDEGCPDDEYGYIVSSDQTDYTLSFCISTRVGDVGPGNNTAKPGEIISCIPNCVLSCGSGSDGCGGTCQNVLESCPPSYACEYEHCIKDLPI